MKIVITKFLDNHCRNREDDLDSDLDLEEEEDPLPSKAVRKTKFMATHTVVAYMFSNVLDIILTLAGPGGPRAEHNTRFGRQCDRSTGYIPRVTGTKT